MTIALALKSSDELDLGITDRRTCRLLVSNMLGKPLYWEETISWDFGEYSRKKHELCILELGRDFPPRQASTVQKAGCGMFMGHI